MEVKFGLLASTSMLCSCFNDFKFCRLVSFAGMTMEVKRSLQRNILRFTCVQSLPNVTCPIAGHRKNTPSPKRTLLPGNTIFSNPLQPSKAKSPMDESPEGCIAECLLANADNTVYRVVVLYPCRNGYLTGIQRGLGGRDVPLVGNFHMLFLCIYNVEEEFLSIFSGDGEIVCIEQGGASQ